MIAPRLNQADLEDIPKHLRDEMEFVFADTIDKVLSEALEEAPATARRRRGRQRVARPSGSPRGHAERVAPAARDRPGAPDVFPGYARATRNRIARRAMAAKKKAAKAGAGALAAGKAARSNEYVQRLVEDAELRANLRDAFESARKAYGRMSNGKSPAKALMDDKKTQRELKEAASSLSEAADQLRGKKKRKRRRRRAAAPAARGRGRGALLLNEGVRNKILDTLFGAEEEFEYTSTTVPSTAPETAGAT